MTTTVDIQDQSNKDNIYHHKNAITHEARPHRAKSFSTREVQEEKYATKLINCEKTDS